MIDRGKNGKREIVRMKRVFRIGVAFILVLTFFAGQNGICRKLRSKII